MKKLSLRLVCLLLSLLFILSGCTSPSNTTEVVVSDEVQELAQDTIEAIDKGQDIESETIISEAKANEDRVEDEAVLESDASVEQENISYDGTNTGKGQSLLGAPTGPIYYSQADSRWGGVMYSNHNDKSQTIKSSGCGPTSAAMIISASKGAILPPTVAKLFVDNNKRTYSNGTEWSAWSFIADYFDFNEYHTTSSFSTMRSYLIKDKNNDKVADYFVVASCGYGLFTTSGHYIVLIGDVDGKITVYDPYLYTGKFTTASRKAANVSVQGTSAIVSESSFTKYSNAVQYWIFSNDYVKPKPTTTTKKQTTTQKVTTTKPTTTKAPTKKTMYVTNVQSYLNVREQPKSTAKIVGKVYNKDKVTVYETKSGYSRIGDKKWVSSSYLTSTKPKDTTVKVTYKTTVGNSYRLKADSILNTKGDFTGDNCKYYSLTECKVLAHYSSTVDKVQIVKTGKTRYVKVKDFKL